MFGNDHKQRVQPAGSFVLPANGEKPGFYRTVNGEAWLYYVMPDSDPMFDAPDAAGRSKAADAMTMLFNQLASLVPDTGPGYRRLSRRLYRTVHILSVATPVRFLASRTLSALDASAAATLNRDFSDRAVTKRVTFFGVRLNSGGRAKGESWLLSQIADIGFIGAYGFESDQVFDEDRTRIDRILRSAGCLPPSPDQWEHAKAWWQTSRNPNSIPALVEAGHMHVFDSWSSAKLAQRYQESGVPCSTWTERESMAGSYAMSMVSLGPLTFEGRDELTDPDAIWAARLLANTRAGGQGALCVSLRGAIEPGRLTAKQMRRDEEKVLNAVDRRYRDQSMDGRDKEKDERHLDQLASMYETEGSAPPTLIDGACIVALPGIMEETSDNQVIGLAYPGMVRFNPLRQEAAFQSMQVGSNVEYSPSPVIWPAPIVEYAGFAGRSTAGEDTGRGRDTDLPGALLGLTEADAQPVYVSASAASAASREPIVAIIGASGSGKTWAAMWLCAQWSNMANPLKHGRGRIPGFIFDPKQKSDFAPFVRAMGGRVRRLDDPALANGALDPVRCMSGSKDFRDEMTNTAVELISSVLDPGNIHPEMQADLMAIIDYGLAHGADCTGEAVAFAARDYESGAGRDAHGRTVLPDSTPAIHDRLRRLASSSSMFRIIYGTRHGDEALKATDGLTLLMAGELNLIPTSDTVPGIIQRWVVRMSALGAAAAMMGRGGYVFVDEAWILLGDQYGAKVAQRFGRLGRLQQYLPILASQRVQEFLDANLQSFISRGLLLSMSGRGEGMQGGSEAQAALRLFGMPDTGLIHDRMAASEFVDMETRAPNWRSLKALRDPDSGRTIRGSVCYYIGLDGSARAVEVTIPQRLFDLLPKGDDDHDKDA